MRLEDCVLSDQIEEAKAMLADLPKPDQPGVWRQEFLAYCDEIGHRQANPILYKLIGHGFVESVLKQVEIKDKNGKCRLVQRSFVRLAEPKPITQPSLPVVAPEPHRVEVGANNTFFYWDAPVRTVVKDGEVWFVAKDVAEILGYAKPENAIAAHCKGQKTCSLESGGQGRNMLIIPERDVYRLIMRSKLPDAEMFEEWVVSEVLPSIRKTGSYTAPQVNTEQASNLELFRLALGSIEETARKVDSITADVNELKDTRKLEHWQALRLRDAVGDRVKKWSQGKPGASMPTLFRRTWNTINKSFGVPRYSEIPAIQFDEALRFIAALSPIDLIV